MINVNIVIKLLSGIFLLLLLEYSNLNGENSGGRVE